MIPYNKRGQNLPDGDNKLVAVPDDRPGSDISELSDSESDTLHRLYPKPGKGEGFQKSSRGRYWTL